MVSLDDAIVIRLKRAGEKFEVLADPDAVLRLREGDEVDLEDAVVTLEIFRDARKGERADTESIKKAFGDIPTEEIVKYILLNGEFHPTTEQRRRMVEEKKKQIATIISKRAIHPQTGTPHPVDRIIKAIEEVRVNIDPFKPVEQQITSVVSAIRRVLPIRIETKKVEVYIPPEYVGKAYPVVKSYDVKKESYLNDGTWFVVIEVPAGMLESVLKELSDITKGAVHTRLIE